MTMLFDAHGHEVVATTQSPEDLRELVIRHEPHVCVLDLRLGGATDSVAALAAISQIAGVADVIVVSGFADAVQRGAGAGGGRVGRGVEGPAR